MQGFYYLLSLVFCGVIGLWFMRNDALPPGAKTTGFLRMKGVIPGKEAAKQPDKPSSGLPH